MTKEDFLIASKTAATEAVHIFPGYAAAETALESAWGTSRLAREANNLFGRKASHDTPLNEILSLPTKEWFNQQWTQAVARWVKFESWAACFQDRMALLRRLAPTIEAYAAALAATDGETFIREVSRSWSTDPDRAEKVLSIYGAHKDLLEDKDGNSSMPSLPR